VLCRVRWPALPGADRRGGAGCRWHV